jgi:hypothetical protein
MKHFDTKKNIVAHYGANNIVCVPYGYLQDLLRCDDAEAYTSGTYGWNADIYGINGTAICTGYRPFGNIRPSRELIERYERLARAELESRNSRGWEELKSALHALACEFVRLATTE